MVPPTLTALVRSGSATESAAAEIAARGNTQVAPATARSVASGSVIEPSTSVKFGYLASSAAFSRLPLEKSSSPATSCPSRSNASARCPPMNPAAPVTHIFAMSIHPLLSGGPGGVRRSHGEGASARLPPLRRDQLLAVAGFGIQ